MVAIAFNMPSTSRNDCIIYCSIESKDDYNIYLQNNLDIFSQWSNIWQMKVNNPKCAV